MDYQYNNFQQYNMPQRPPKKSIALALTGFILSILTMLLCCCSLVPAVAVFLFIISFVSLLLCVISLISKKGGTGFAVVGMLIAGMMCVVYLLSFTVFRGINEDMLAFSADPQKYVDDYNETGEIPEEFQEYTDPKYDWFWKAMGLDGFEDFYGQFIEQYNNQNYSYSYSYSYSNRNDDEEESSTSPSETTTLPANYGEDPITI